MTATTIGEAVSKLASGFGGQLLQPGEPGYEEARRVQNGLIDRRPALIARVGGTADVIAALQFARARGLEVAVRGGGHNVAGVSATEGGVLVDLSALKGIHIDRKRGTARVQGGVTWAELDREAQLFGLATTGGVVSSTGVAGLTLGGGLGWLMGKYGVAADNLVSVELVTADEKVVTASAEDDPDLLWALRGGGGNFGIATSLELRLHPVGPIVTGGLVAHPLPAAREALRFYREVTASLPDELTVFAGLMHGPDGSKIAGIAVCHCGPLEEGEAAVRPIKAFGPPVMDMMGPMPYVQVNQLLDGAFPKGALNYWKSSFLSQLSDQAIDAAVDALAAAPSPMCMIMLEHFHGAATSVPSAHAAFPHRNPGYNVLVIGEWLNREDSERCTAWVRDTYEALRPSRATGRYLNYLDGDEPADAIAAAFGANHPRLRQLKTRYDPENRFRRNHNIAPAP